MIWRSLLISFSLTFCVDAFASDAANCLRQTLGFQFNRATVSENLDAIPTLKKTVLEILDDPAVPLQLKKILKHGLQDRKVEIVELTQELRQAWGFRDTTGAIARNLPEGKFWNYEYPSGTGLQRTNAEFKTNTAIAIPGRADAMGNQPLDMLVHELAHIKFNSFLAKNFDAICEKLPASLAYPGLFGKGWVMNGEFRTLLHEKYAHEFELKIHEAAQGKWHSEWNERWKGASQFTQKRTPKADGADAA